MKKKIIFVFIFKNFEAWKLPKIAKVNTIIPINQPEEEEKEGDDDDDDKAGKS